MSRGDQRERDRAKAQAKQAAKQKAGTKVRISASIQKQSWCGVPSVAFDAALFIAIARVKAIRATEDCVAADAP